MRGNKNIWLARAEVAAVLAVILYFAIHITFS